MKHLDEYRDAAAARELIDLIRRETARPCTLMEVCGGQTHAFLRFGLDQLLPPEISLLHGPGCPVCVTPVALLDAAIELAGRPEVMVASFGDMLRVPGTRLDLMSARAAGGNVKIVYSPLDAVALARQQPASQVVFFAVGFETTAPATAMAVLQAAAARLDNFSLLVAHVRVPPALTVILRAPERHVEGFLAAGHVCAVMGQAEYVPLAREFRVPIVITGFEPLDLLRGIYAAVRQLRQGRAEVENAYARVVRPEGNLAAQAAIRRVFRISDREWRGLGVIPDGGLELNEEYSRFDARRRFGLAAGVSATDSLCPAGAVLTGMMRPTACPHFGGRCTPESPLGAPMVSAEGACAAYYRYRATPT